jgi:hypothetical protein
MKRIYVILLLLAWSGLYAQNQEDAVSSKSWGDMIEHVIPEMPAVNMFDNKPSSIITPSTVKEIAFEVVDYKSFGVELSPLLWSPNLNLSDYNKNKFWYRLRLSLGTTQLADGSWQIAEGVRFTIIDKTDLRDNSLREYHDNLIVLGFDKIDRIEEAIKKYDSIKGVNDTWDRYFIERDSIVRSGVNVLLDDTIEKKINALRAQKKKELWNAPIWEMGFASMQASNENNFNDFHFCKFALWTTLGRRFGNVKTKFGQSNQILVSGKFDLIDSLQTTYPKTTVSAGFYYGVNDLRFFVQAGYEYINKTNTGTAALGAIFKVYDGIWIYPALNFVYGTGNSVQFEPRVNLLFGMQRKKITN